jgi:predicted transcriptional regulator
MGLTEDIEPVLEEVDFLCRSVNRVVVLDALTEGSFERRELGEQTGVSRPTLGRILDDFEERNWVVQNDRKYRATAVGELIVESLDTFLEQMATARALAPMMQWMPPEGLGFDVRRLRDAEIVYATTSDPLAPLRQLDEWLQSGGRVHLVSYEITASGLDAVGQAIDDHDEQLVAIFTPGVYDAIEQDPEMLAAFRELLGADNAEFYVSTEQKPVLLTIFDDRTCIGLAENGIPQAVLVSEDDAVRSWAVETFAEYRDRAEPVESTAFTA